MANLLAKQGKLFFYCELINTYLIEAGEEMCPDFQTNKQTPTKYLFKIANFSVGTVA